MPLPLPTISKAPEPDGALALQSFDVASERMKIDRHGRAKFHAGRNPAFVLPRGSIFLPLRDRNPVCSMLCTVP